MMCKQQSRSWIVRDKNIDDAKDWIIEVKEILENEFPKEILAAITRVPSALVNVKPDAYIPQVVSFGPFHHRSRDLSRMEKYKLIPAARFDKRFKGRKRFCEVVESIKKPQLKSKMEDFYYLNLPEGCLFTSDDELTSFAWMMALDALFILEFLHNDYSLPVEVDIEPFDISSLEVCIKCDFLKLENQIPLFILKKVYLEMELPAKSDAEFETRTLKETLKKTCLALSPFDKFDSCSKDSFIVSFKEASHFLGLMHKHVSDLVEIKAMEQRESAPLNVFRRILSYFQNIMEKMCNAIFSIFRPPGDDFLPSYNVQELSKAGINFQAFSSNSEKIRFDKTTSTLHLPVITISDTTEIILRNLLALEFNNPNRAKHVTRYVELMDCLIDAGEDICLLRKFDVIKRRGPMVTDASIAKIWNGMCKPFFAGFFEPPHELKDGMKEALRKNYWKSKMKKVLFEGYQRYLSRPWQLLALLCGIFILIMEIAQAYCLFRECNHSEAKFPNGSPERKHF
eukprot:Gb_40233 [translate_table: standard]